MPLPGIPQIPNRPSKRYYQLAVILALASLIWRGCDFLDTHDLPFLEKYVRRVDSAVRTSTIVP